MLRLSDQDVPDRERLSYLHDFVARCVAGLHFTPRDDSCFSFDLVSRKLDAETVVGSARYSAVRGARTRELTADGRRNYMLTIHTADYEIHLSRGRNVHVARGDVVIVSEGLEQSFTMPDTSLSAIVLDERRMNALAPSIGAAPLHHIPACAPGAALLSGYSRMLLENSDLDEAGGRLAATHLHELAALALDRREARQAMEPPGLGDARLAMIRQDMLSNLTDPELNIAAVARRQRVTPRYVQRLLEREGTTFSRFLRDQRLDLARDAIISGDSRTISAIAFDCGFGDLSHFNKAFRQRFAATPRDLKAATMMKIRRATNA